MIIADFFSNPVVLGWIAPIVVAAVIGIWNFSVKKIKGRKIGIPYRVKRHKAVDVFYEYCKKNKVSPVISYGDTNALKVSSELKKKKVIIKGKINLQKKPQTNDNRDFVMILLNYVPAGDFTYFYKKGYSFSFDIKSETGVCGVQLEIKDIHMVKIIDEFISVSKSVKHCSFKLSDYFEVGAWKEIREICFTVFTEKEYINQSRGTIELSNCILQVDK